jgi:hypothetical protein
MMGGSAVCRRYASGWLLSARTGETVEFSRTWFDPNQINCCSMLCGKN